MKTRIVLILLAVLLVLSLAGCTSSSPTAVVRSFYRYVQNGQYDKATALFSQTAIDQWGISKIEQMLQTQKETLDAYGGVKKFEVTNQTIIQNRALVEVKLTLGDGEEQTDSVNLVKESGQWKIAISK